jgi:hypothetical protein
MKGNKKYFAIGGIIILVVGFFAYKRLAKKKSVMLPTPTDKSTPIDMGTPTNKRTSTSKDGYIDEACTFTWEYNCFSVLTRSGTRLRSSSSTNSTIKHTYTAGNPLLVRAEKLEKDGMWYEVQDFGNSPILDKNNFKRAGWVRSDVVDRKMVG